MVRKPPRLFLSSSSLGTETQSISLPTAVSLQPTSRTRPLEIQVVSQEEGTTVGTPTMHPSTIISLSCRNLAPITHRINIKQLLIYRPPKNLYNKQFKGVGYISMTFLRRLIVMLSALVYFHHNQDCYGGKRRKRDLKVATLPSLFQ